MNVNKCTKAGGTFIFWVADWFALMNDKMGTLGGRGTETATAAATERERKKREGGRGERE